MSQVLALVTVTLVLATGPTWATGPAHLGVPDWSVVDPVLGDALLNGPSNEGLEVIVQFDGEVTSRDRDTLDALGLRTMHTFDPIHAVFAIGPSHQMLRLAGYDRVAWMELNEPIEPMMEDTLSVVNATLAWRSYVDGTLWGDEGIDGSGVTVVVIDSGIDAGHPDLDYGTKTIRNIKSDTGYGPWYEIENGDTSSGHGTHCAGTVAGNGDASAGQRRGVAPGANLIGLSTGELNWIISGLGGLEWVYEHSRPGNNPYNIRVVSNSWGSGGGQYDPQDAISQMINRLAYDNNVVVAFAAGNSGGSGDDVRSSWYGNTPAAICVAAAGHDGTYMTDFSSKGQWNWVDTWPDLAAPGHNVMSTAARRTQISVMTKDPGANPYYLSISGTSMATPHVAGTAALLFQAAPSLRMSDVIQDAGIVIEEDGVYVLGDPEGGNYGNLPYTVEEWQGEALDTSIHEVELILKLTADPIPTDGTGDPDQNGLSENYVPVWSLPGAESRQHDFSQGYGLLNVHRAVGLALTLEKMRLVDTTADVASAYSIFEDVFETREVVQATDQVVTSWGGEWSRFNDQANKPVFTSNQTKYVPVPEGAEEVTVSLAYHTVDTTSHTSGTLGFRIDFDDDGTWDHTSPLVPVLGGVRTATIPVSGTDGAHWKFDIIGQAVKVHRPGATHQFEEARIEYDITVLTRFSGGGGMIAIPHTDDHSIVADLRFTSPSEGYAGGEVSIERDVYNLNNIVWEPGGVAPPFTPEEPGTGGWWVVALLLLVAFGAYTIARLRPGSIPGKRIIAFAEGTGIAWAMTRARGLVRLVGRTIERPLDVKASKEEDGDAEG